MSRFDFADPLWLLALLPLAALVAWSWRRGRRAAAVYSSAQLLEGLPRSTAQRLRPATPFLLFLALGLVVVALARPRIGSEEHRVRREGVAIVAAIDRSHSMAALDFEVDGQPITRLQAAKRVLRDFIAGGQALPGRPSDLIGLVAFGGYAESLAPLTFDHQALQSVLDGVELPPDRRGEVRDQQELQLAEQEGATAIGDAIALGVERLRQIDAKSRVVVLLSDGENTAGAIEPADAARIAAGLGVRVHTIGIGRTGPAPFLVTDRLGRKRTVTQVVRLDERALREVAETTDGKYFHAENAEALREVYAAIDTLEKTEIEGEIFTYYDERFQLALLPGCGLLALLFLARATRFRTVP